MKSIERFLKYISFDTQSDPYSNTSPSSVKQFDLGNHLVNELKQIGIDNAFIDNYGYVYGYLPSNCGCKKTIGLIAHMDTSFDASGKDIKPMIIEKYDGSVIKYNNNKNIELSPKEFPSLNKKIGHQLICTDGTTLLGADDKAGIAIIISTIESILNSSTQYPNIIITFTPDEEIGEGTKNFNYNYYKEKNCSFAYTLDGGDIEEISFENFNAASCIVKVIGKSIHPGSAKGKMINSQLIAMEFQSMLPQDQLPSLTEGYEGFYHLTAMSGSVEESTLEYIIRNHNKQLFENQKQLVKDIEKYLNKKYGEDTVKVTVNDSYLNMSEIILQHPEILEYAIKGLKRNGLNPTFLPIRGGTDGARLSFEGIYTPNLGTGGENFHGPYEYLDVTDMEKMIKVLISILHIITE